MVICKRIIKLLFFISSFLILSQFAWADRVILKSGKAVEGEILKETEDYVIMSIYEGKATARINKTTIESIEKSSFKKFKPKKDIETPKEINHHPLLNIKKTKAYLKVGIVDFVFLTTVDIILSLFCLWLTIGVLIRRWGLPVKNYLWFLFIFNLSWLILLLLFRGARSFLNFAITRLRPDLIDVTAYRLSIAMLIAATLIYIWLLARTFSLNFFGALKLFLVSHLLYILIVFLSLSLIRPKENRWFNLVKENMGLRPMIDNYLSDIHRVISGQDKLFFLTLRPFHL